MDPLTQGVLGGVASQLVSKPKEKVAALVVGALSGMAADLDVLISSAVDPLLFLEYHRHFTHSLLFVPIGALLCAAFFCWVCKRWFAGIGLSFKNIYVFAFAGYATHTLLDACTTYGTQLLWPFSSARVAWNAVSVVDPLFSLPLLLLLGVAVYRRSTRVAVLSWVYVFGYLGLGFVQQHRATQFAESLAAQRGHSPSQLGVKPSFANLFVWKSVYEYEGRYYVDAIRVGGSHKIYQGVSIEKLALARHFPWLDNRSQQAKDIERFRWFSNQHLALDPGNPNRIIDVRYSLIPNQVTGMWGIVLDAKAQPHQHVKWTSNRPQGAQARERAAELFDMVMGR